MALMESDVRKTNTVTDEGNTHTRTRSQKRRKPVLM